MAPTSDDHPPSRRRVLRATGATLATGLSALGAGCSSLPPLGTQIRFGSVDVPGANPPSYREWLPVPSAFPDDTEENEGYDVLVHAPPPADAPEWARGSIARSLVASATDYVGVHVDDVDVAFTTAMGGGNTAALLGEVDQSAVRDTLAHTSYEPDGSGNGYDVYTRADIDRSVGVLRDGLVFGNGPSARDVIRATVEAARGEAPRLHEDDENVDVLTNSAGMRRWAWIWPSGVGRTSGDGILTDTVGWATTFDHDDDSAYLVQTWLFPPEYDLTAGKVKRSLKGNGPGAIPDATEVSAVDVSVDGRVATIAMYMGPDVVREEFADGVLQVPYVTWGVSNDPDAERLTFTHEAGDPVRTDWLTIEGSGQSVPAASAGDVGDRIEPGEELTVSTADAEPESTVQVVYENPDLSSSASLFSYELP